MSEPMPRGDQLSRQWRLLQLIDRPQGITVGDATSAFDKIQNVLSRDALKDERWRRCVSPADNVSLALESA